MCRILCWNEMEYAFHFFVNNKECDCWITSSEFVYFSKKLPNCLPKWLKHFSYPTAINNSFCCFTSLPEFDVVCVLDFGHSNRYIFLHIVSITILYHMYRLQIFYPSLWLIFSFSWLVFFRVECLILMKSSLSIISFTDHAFFVVPKES